MQIFTVSLLGALAATTQPPAPHSETILSLSYTRRRWQLRRIRAIPTKFHKPAR